MTREQLLDRKAELRNLIAFTAGQRQRLADELKEAEREEDEACAELRQVETSLAELQATIQAVEDLGVFDSRTGKFTK